MSFTKIISGRASPLLLLTVVVISWVNFNTVRWKNADTINHDVAGYYSYLPALFYEKDLGLSFLLTKDQEINQHYYSRSSPGQSGKKVLKCSMGMAISYLPFFAAAHLYCVLTNEVSNGFTTPFHFAIQFSSLFYVLLGLFYIRKILLLYFEEITVFLTLISILFGTNLLYYTTIGAGMPHATNFALLSTLLYLIIKWHNQPGIGISVLLGLLIGLLTLIRPINLLFVLIFLLYRIDSKQKLKNKFQLFSQHSVDLMVMGLTAFILFVPQLLYWKWSSGQYLFNSYVGEGFFFEQPQIINGLFSFRKGWLLYTPMMLFAIIGLFNLKKQVADIALSVYVLLPLYCYVIFSWWCWWYGGSFGQRAMIDLYPLLAFPLAVFIDKWRQLSLFKKSGLGIIWCLFFLLNIFQTMQAKWNLIHFDSMTKAAYYDAFLRLNTNPEREKFLKHPDYEKALRGEIEYP